MSETVDRDEAAKAFAVELVALARKHGADHLRLTFDMRGHTEDWRAREKWSHGDITLEWSQGRHAALDHISLRYESHVSIMEQAP
jgi:hypothetical protein